MTTVTRRPSPGYWMNLPEGWIPLDLDSGERIPVQVERLIAERAAADPAVAVHRGQIERQIAGALRAARVRQLSFAAMLATFTSTGLPVAASLALTRHRRPDGASAGDILADLESQRGKTASMLELPDVGPIVRCSYLDRLPIEGRTEVAEFAIFQYYLPVPGGRDLVVATGATPTLPMTEIFGQLFDAILSTFQFVDDVEL
jgi:hypothetical protein